ncbi:glycoside hydrolase family 3 C-terminal domain-containing protein [Cellulomonas sp. ACRRI]|uniref:glycoside hydrolase family 3 C-terminal domain-containing protein n=1 Tax=Cellulomonas sp. ACRRI TaxID=2918188 RepID=UPI001EF2D7DF|nr:glycoside hydrolase family 3 C-terminal domain-containing protein [Cellulomonas sp. ACRRI]MCG7286255.1 glycoside hydrolase family 3 C-terminal domain-containing protein [Cellulomonas sp. ACRRI]
MNARAKNADRAKRPMSNKKFLWIWVPVLSLVTVIAVVANVALVVAGGWVASQFGSGTYEFTNAEESADWDTEYYSADYDSIDEVDAAAKELVEEISGAGIVLAKNEGQALPLAAGASVTMLGRAAADPVFGGSGSGSVDTNSAVNARQGLENAGFTVNDAVYGAIEAYAAENPRGFIEMDRPDISTYFIGEMPVDGYEAQSSSFAEYSDAAVIYIGRPGGEGGDLTRDMSDWDDNAEPGQHQLELNKDEKDLIELAKANFDTVVVVVNSSTTIEMGDLQADTGVDAILLAGSPGATGLNAVGTILSGEVNPSGRTADLWAADFTADPTFVNFGGFLYDGLSVSYPVSAVETATSNATVTDEAPFVNYAEGIYVGYRYYETAAAEGFLDYDEAVVYPFGYGLSYTDFAWTVTGTQAGEVDGTIAVTVDVTNTGTVAGKDVVELYYTAPYTPGGIEKSEVVLGDFAKTGVIEPGASESVTLELPVEDMASYDYAGEQAYVLEAGDYAISVRTDSHTVAAGTEPITYTVDSDVVYSGENHRSTDLAEVTNQFDDVSAQFSTEPGDGTIVPMSRADFAGTFPTAPTGDQLVASDAVAEGFAAWDVDAQADAFDGDMPTTGASTDLSLIDLRGVPKDDPQWDELLDSLSVGDMTDMLLNGAYQTAAIGSIGKPQTTEPDGPAGFSSFINSSINGVAYPSEFLIAQTWDVDLGRAMGEMLGNEAMFKDINGWYAPAANLHRSPFAGRNFEYYSEDPFLSGLMMTSVANGAAEKGVYTTLKHFALNDQETNRVNNGIATWATEQTIRELYLKPFEMAVKNISMEVPYLADDEGTIETTTVGATAIMSSFNRIGATWAGGSEALMTDVLRGEWGFEGFAISDFNLYPYMNPNQSISAGTDLTLTFQPSKSFGDTSSAKAVSDIREATHNILFTVANSNAMNGLAPGATVSYTPPTWVYLQIGASILVGLLVVAGALLVTRRVLRHRKTAEPAAPQGDAEPVSAGH